MVLSAITTAVNLSSSATPAADASTTDSNTCSKPARKCATSFSENRFSIASAVTFTPSSAAVATKSLVWGRGVFITVRTMVLSSDAPENFRCRRITPVARPISSSFEPKLDCNNTATLFMIPNGSSFFQDALARYNANWIKDFLSFFLGQIP